MSADLHTPSQPPVNLLPIRFSGVEVFVSSGSCISAVPVRDTSRQQGLCGDRQATGNVSMGDGNLDPLG